MVMSDGIKHKHSDEESGAGTARRRASTGDANVYLLTQQRDTNGSPTQTSDWQTVTVQVVKKLEHGMLDIVDLLKVGTPESKLL